MLLMRSVRSGEQRLLLRRALSNWWYDLAACGVGHSSNINILPIMQQGSVPSFLTGGDSVQLQGKDTHTRTHGEVKIK